MIKKSKIEKSRRIHKTYFKELERYYRFAIPEGMRVLELGCHTGRLLAGVKPERGIGIDNDPVCIDTARIIHSDNPALQFIQGNVESFDWSGMEAFDYIILSDLTPLLEDVQNTLQRLQAVCKPSTRIILNFQNNIWYPALKIASFIGLRTRYKSLNWLSRQDIQNLLYLSGYESVTRHSRILLPLGIPFLSAFVNRFLVKMPVFQQICLTCCVIARPEHSTDIAQPENEHTVSVLVPTRNERGNIEAIFKRTPHMGKWTELIFVDGNSDDGTVEAIEAGIKTYGKDWHRAVLLKQTGIGKGQAVRQGFDECQGDILMILDSDLTMPAEELPKYFRAVTSGRGEFINGSRLVYPMKKRAMRFLNMIANKIFAVLFTWLLEQPVKDTLCGTKVLWRSDYDKIAANRSYFGDFDPFGDFDLLFGASRLNLKIVDLPIRYQDRTYGEIKIDRWRHGWLLVKMCGIAFKRLKLS